MFINKLRDSVFSAAQGIKLLASIGREEKNADKPSFLMYFFSHIGYIIFILT